MTISKLSSGLTSLKGVGEVMGGSLVSLGLETVEDLLNFFPRRYDDFSQLAPIAKLRPGLVSVRAKVDHLKVRSSFKRRHMTITEAIVSDQTGSLKLTWFNSPWVSQQLETDNWYYFLGDLKFAANSYGITQPVFEPAQSSSKAGKILPVYSESAAFKITTAFLRTLVAQCIEVCDQLPEEIPDFLLDKFNLISRAQAVRELHQPTSDLNLKAAQKRMAFAELFLHLAAGQSIKQDLATEPGIPIPFNQDLAKQFVASLAFKLTDDQRSICWQIISDLGQDRPMNRLLEGDVGSGKTVVAAFVALQAIRAGYQVAIMVPTEILARQHLVTFSELFKPWDITPRLLTGKLTSTDRNKVISEITDGQAELIIGTQALITKHAGFNSLGLIVIDEQHRFGVKQRLDLKDKAGRLPHVLTMTATPIPRSLALVLYGDLDISILKQLPPGRQIIKTQVVFQTDRPKIYSHIDELIGRGQQIYIVCPAIDESDNGGMKAVTTEFKRLQRSIFKHRRIGLLHGRMKALDKSAVMEQFVAGQIDILVATTVIEVGVHVANASAMIIEGAERFGLATLHQLRGRVGRGSEAAFCYLFTSKLDEVAIPRLRALERTHDGFRLAQVDLETRGPGQIYGTRQAGVLDLRFARLDDKQMIEEAREAAKAFLTKDNIVKYPYTVERINRLKSVTSLD